MAIALQRPSTFAKFERTVDFMQRHWIFIRGLGRHSLHWGPFIESFQKSFPEDQIEFLDLRGNGTFAQSPSLMTIKDNVRDLRSRSEFLKKHSPVYLMTISLGSMVGVEWAHSFPDEVAGLVTMNTSDRGNSPFFDRMKPFNYLHPAQSLAKRIPIPLLDQALEKWMRKAHKAYPLKDSPYPETSPKNLIRQLVAAGRYEFPKQKPKTEILMLCSDGDLLVSSACTKKIAQMWTLKPHVHPTGGHDLPIDAPEWICDEVHNWIVNLQS